MIGNLWGNTNTACFTCDELNQYYDSLQLQNILSKMVDMYYSEFLTVKLIIKIKIYCKYWLENHALLERLFIVESIVIPKNDHIIAEKSILHSQ